MGARVDNHAASVAQAAPMTAVRGYRLLTGFCQLPRQRLRAR